MFPVIVELLKLLFFDVLFLGLFLLAIIPLAIYRHAAYAVLKRNFLAYFNNPTGYAFLCMFVLLSSFAAFWPYEFFNANLASLDQLSGWFPYIMLVFIPAITMSIWAEERRQGTDELLLTIPADDFDIVLGKYLAAVSVYTVSLLFSQLTNYAVLNALTLGDLDTGLFVATYIGYWMIGLAMLSLGMVASFLTGNLTVGFILGALFNAPLVFAAAAADAITVYRDFALTIARWSYSAQFEVFGRGVVSLSSATYFLMVVVVGIYLSMVLIGRRHWLGGRDGASLLGHYLVRTLALIGMAVGANLLFAHHDFIRYDATDEQISSLSPATKKLMRDLQLERPIYIEAFISKSLPETYVKTKFDLISLLNEFEATGGGKIIGHIYDDLEPFSEEAVRAEEQYDIKAETVLTRSRGAFKQEDIFLGAAFFCGLEKVVVSFFDHGIPVEYELVRSICTVAQEKRQKIGVVKTDADLFGGFQFMGMAPRNIPKQLIIDELEKQYDVVQVDPNNPIVEKYDVLMAVQPSSLTQPQLDNLVDAIRDGTPTAIFEDPMPVALNSAPGTGEPKRPPGGMFGRGQPPEPKGNIRQLWEMIQINMLGEDSMMGGSRDLHIVWQDYNPYPKVRGFRQITREWVFVGPDAPGADDPLNSSQPVTSGLKQLLFLFPGAIIEESGDNTLTFSPLVATGNRTGTVKWQDMMDTRDDPLMHRIKEGPLTNKRYVLAAHIRGELKEQEEEEGENADEGTGGNGDEVADEEGSNSGEEKKGQDASQTETENEEKGEGESDAGGEEDEDQKGINVVFVADIDLMHSDFLRLRARPEGEVNWQFDNVTFVLNVLDVLAGDDRFVEIRKRQTRHSTLKTIELQTEKAREDADQETTKFEKDYTELEEKAKKQMEKNIKELQDEVDKIKERQREGNVPQKEVEAAVFRLAMKQRVEEKRRETEVERLKRERDRKLKEIERELDLETLKVQNMFKNWAVWLPPVPPLLVGLVVFTYRRLREREGVSKARLK